MGFSEDNEQAKRLLQDLAERGLGRSSKPQEMASTRTTPDDLALGKMALERGLLTVEQFQECLRQQEAVADPGSKSLLGKILIERGYVKTEDVLELFREQTQRSQIILSIPRYEIQDKIGEGATAIVYRALDRELQRPVALKVLREEATLKEIARERFHREAQAAAGLAHPNIVQIHDVGETSGRLYIVMELVQGRPLSEVLAAGDLEERKLVEILEKVARGVAAAHDKGVVHRDLKPANILVATPGEPKVGDFGLAHLADAVTVLTRTGATLGTPLYMSPEQVEGRSSEITTRTDVYALGAILYEILTRRPPHLADTVSEIYGKIVNVDPIPPRKLNSKVPTDFETIALKAIAKDPRKRYPTAEAFANDLRRALEGEPIQARPVSGAERLWRKAVKNRTLVIPSTAAILLGIVICVFLIRQSAVPPRNMVVFERLEGDVRTIEKGKESSAHQGQILDAGQGVASGPYPSAAVLRFQDGARMEIGPETVVSEIHANPIRRLVIFKGAVRADSPSQVARDKPMIFVTPYGKAEGSGRILRLFVDAGLRKGAHVEVEEGSLDLRDSEGRVATIRGGQLGEMRPGAPPVAAPLALSLDLGDGITMDLVHIKPGAFTMGGSQAPAFEWQADSRPEHQVTLTKSYYMGKYEVTRKQFAAFIRATSYQTDAERSGIASGTLTDGSWGGIRGASWKDPVVFKQADTHPVVCVSWKDAEAFCDWATKKTGRRVNLPTEAEWEYACRAGTKTTWSFGGDGSAMEDFGWLRGNSAWMTHPVGQKKPNLWGLHDMNGNVWEWCQDWVARYTGDAVDPKGPPEGKQRSLRGGGFNFDCESAFRAQDLPAHRNTHYGFRVVAR